MVKYTFPKNETAIGKAYLSCQNNKRFRQLDKNSCSDYVVRSQKDLNSAYNDLKNEDFYWARIKAYQALFHMLNALLVKNLGYYSKDHGCIINALLKHKIIRDDTATKLHLIVNDTSKKSIETSDDAIQDIDDFRLQRNFALYKPKAWEDITKEDIEKELQKIKNNINILAGLL